MEDRSNKVLCYYHSADNDGYFSGALVKYFYEFLYPEVEVVLKGWTYSRDMPKLSKLLGYKQIYLVDLHWDNKLMLELYKEYKENFIWNDHHKSSIDEFYDFFYSNKVPMYISFKDDTKPNLITGIQSCEYSACRNTWKWFEYLSNKENIEVPILEIIKDQLDTDKFPKEFSLEEKDKTLPLWLYFLSTFDNWNRRDDKEFWDNYLMPFEYYARYLFRTADDAYNFIKEWTSDYNTKYAISVWNNDYVFNWIKQGKFLLEYQQKLDDRDTKFGYSKEVIIDDGKVLKCFILNTQRRGSIIFKNLKDVETYDMLIPWYKDKDKYNYSAYSFKQDIYIPGIYIKGYKFNGHPTCAGCQAPIFLFD